MGNPAEKLLDELRSLLDETTIISISSDYNLENPDEFAAARQVLLTISRDVEAEEATGFNPSGIGADDVLDINPSNQDGDADAAGTVSSDVRSIGATTESSMPPSLVSSSSSKSSSNEIPGLLHLDIFDGLSDNEKEQTLAEMFVNLKPIDAKLALQKSKGDVSLAMDELLNLQWLEQTGQRPKGVDGFYVSDEDNAPSKKKKKGKKKKMKVASTKTTPSEYTPKETNNNDSEQNDHITFISDRLALSRSEVTAIYHQQNASPGATVVQILKNYIAFDAPLSDTHLLAEAQREIAKHTWVPHEYILAAFEVCATRDGAVDIVGILANYFEKPAYLKYDVSYSVVASNSEVVEAESGFANVPNLGQLPKSPVRMRSPAIELPQRTLSTPTNLQAAAAASKALADSRNHSFASASAAFKKGRSDPLFRAAGSYYAERAREQASIFRQATSVEANHLVDQTSTKDSIDLHGITVHDGVDIALDRVRRWWQGLGEERARKAKEGFTVITGRGRHSADGKSRLRINVVKALVSDGWKVEVETGSYRVTGRR
ncbi:hypothetical protein M426DRAFT_316138 [Hypoxylon sp. CI-4A]|nr:hypothetical protein M426DRAFT_316138 [Hypoxylon sp. CI-4A]